MDSSSNASSKMRKKDTTHKRFYKDTIYRKKCLADQQHFILHEEHVAHNRIVMIGKA